MNAQNFIINFNLTYEYLFKIDLFLTLSVFASVILEMRNLADTTTGSGCPGCMHLIMYLLIYNFALI